jgi:hypothetical protein
LDLQEQISRFDENLTISNSSNNSSNIGVVSVVSHIEPDRDVALLIRTNREMIDNLRLVLGNDIDFAWDDLMLLRFVCLFVLFLSGK